MFTSLCPLKREFSRLFLNALIILAKNYIEISKTYLAQHCHKNCSEEKLLGK
jgi:hypothetical protein